MKIKFEAERNFKVKKNRMSTSAFRKLRLAAGYKTAAALARTLANTVKVPTATAIDWDRRGRRPQWRYMQPLAKIFGVDLAQAISLIWKEARGDRCSCGCGGEKILPTRETAIHLYVQRTCRCGKTRIFRSNQHAAGCNNCGLGDKMVPRITLTCVGYRPYGARVATFSRNCPREVTVRQSRFKYSRTNYDDDLQRPFMNETERKFRCIRCAGAFVLLKATETRLKRFWVLANPNQNVPEIRSLKQLGVFQKACYKLTYTRADGHVVAFHPSFFLTGAKRPHKGDARPRSDSYIKSMLAGHARRRLPKSIHGLCLVCDKLLIAGGGYDRRPPTVHRRCLWEYQRKHGPHTSPTEIANPRRRGRPIELDNLRKHYSWAIRHKLGGESFTNIATEFGITKQSVAEGIQFIISHLPDTPLVSSRFQKRILLLRS